MRRACIFSNWWINHNRDYKTKSLFKFSVVKFVYKRSNGRQGHVRRGQQHWTLLHLEPGHNEVLFWPHLHANATWCTTEWFTVKCGFDSSWVTGRHAWFLCKIGTQFFSLSMFLILLVYTFFCCSGFRVWQYEFSVFFVSEGWNM